MAKETNPFLVVVAVAVLCGAIFLGIQFVQKGQPGGATDHSGPVAGGQAREDRGIQIPGNVKVGESKRPESARDHAATGGR
ncbi:MAG: hypothetical protein HY318_10815 [Armatimonadetes bacterium]|nr:hypothetical protein [Armatimonadota bacterium]